MKDQTNMGCTYTYNTKVGGVYGAPSDMLI